MKEISLTQGQVALVDDDVFDALSKHKWYARWDSKIRGFYAVRGYRSNGKRKSVYMHRIIMDAQPEQWVDHISHNALDNQRTNLRPCTNTENTQNGKKRAGGTSIYKGVCWYMASGKWQVRIMLNGQNHHLGYFTDENMAARAYDTAARKHFGEFACCNFPEAA